MLNFLNAIKKESNLTHTENGAVSYRSTENFCLDLFFRAGAMREAPLNVITSAVRKAYTENPSKAMKIIFYARDIRGGLGERRFFRCAISALVGFAPEAVRRNLPYFAEYGRFDDLCVLLGTPLEKDAADILKAQLDADINAMKNHERASLLAKWLPSVNTSSEETRKNGRKLASLFGMTECQYRKTLSTLRKYTDILENRLREQDYSFRYDIQPSCAMFKYRKAFLRNDNERYKKFLAQVSSGEKKLNTSTLYPYDIVRAVIRNGYIPTYEREALDVSWNALPDLTAGKHENAIAVIDGSGSMTWTQKKDSVRPIDAALSLGLYFAEHSEGTFANHFITFSMRPQLVEVKGNDIVEKIKYCESFNECANTDLEAVFELILKTAIKHSTPPEQLPSKMYIISDMQFDGCIIGGNDETLFNAMQKRYRENGYKLPDVIFWNVESRGNEIPVTRSQTGAALVSGFSPSIFNMVMEGEVSPERIMDNAVLSERYSVIK